MSEKKEDSENVVIPQSEPQKEGWAGIDKVLGEKEEKKEEIVEASAADQRALTATDYLRKATNILAAHNNEVSNIPNNSEYWSSMNAYRAAKRGDI